MAEQHTHMTSRPNALTIEALQHGGFVVTDHDAHFRRGMSGHVAAFTRLSDAINWMEEQMNMPKAGRPGPNEIRA